MSLPSNVGFGCVTGTFLLASGDGSDAGSEPDGVPLVGLTVRFVASVSRVVNRAAVPPVSILLDTVACTTNENGVLVDAQGSEGVWLVASSDEDVDPHGWTWTVTISSTTITKFSTTFSLDPGQTLDLATLIPVPSSPGSQLAAWQAVVAEITGGTDGLEAMVDQAAASAGVAQAAADSVDRQLVTATAGGIPGTLLLSFPAMAAGPYPHTVMIPIGA